VNTNNTDGSFYHLVGSDGHCEDRGSHLIDYGDYCRQLEAYLCQKNGGHLIRIVGPAFEQVRGWAEQGIPLTVAQRGIDRVVERRAAKGSSRARPIRIEFCEHDILEVYGEWRRAVGVTLSASEPELPQPRKPALTSHVERIVARLVARRTPRSPGFERYLERLLAELDRLSAESRQARGDARAVIVERLSVLDGELMAMAAAELESGAAAQAQREAESELATLGSRLAPDVRSRAVQAAYERLVRDLLGLPVLRYD
jgi:hypothetical protein